MFALEDAPPSEFERTALPAELAGPPIALRPLAPSLEMTVALWWRGDRHLSPAARAFRQFAEEHRP